MIFEKRAGVLKKTLEKDVRMIGHIDNAMSTKNFDPHFSPVHLIFKKPQTFIEKS